MDKKKYHNKNFSASPVFIIHISIAIPYNSSHNVMFTFVMNITYILNYINPLNVELNPICYLLALLGAHHFLHVSRIRVNHPNFSILSAYKNSIKVKLSFPVQVMKKYRARRGTAPLILYLGNR